MTDITVSAPTDLAPKQQQQRPLAISAKVKTALDAMVWQGLKRGEAAQIAGLKEHSLYVALSRPHNKTYYLSQLEVLRTSERARNIHALADVRDGSNQMARVQAVKALEQLSDDPQANAQRIQTPGLVVVINTQPVATPPVTIDCDTSKQYQGVTREQRS